MPEVNAAFNPDWIDVARLMLTSRIIDEIEEEELVPQGKINYQFSSRGHELAQVLLGLLLDHDHDGAYPYYRSRPFMLASGMSPREVFAGDMACTGSLSEGRDVGVMYSMPSRGRAVVLPSSGDVGAQYTPAAGWAQAVTYYQRVLEDKSWDGAIAVTMGGDGSVATNGFWAALTIATTLELPLLFFIEDNGYGISVPRHYQTPGGDIAPNLESFKNLYVLAGPGIHPLETAELIHQAVQYVREGNGACLLRLRVPRLTGHTFGEDQTAYKSEEEIEKEKERDPMQRMRDHLDGEVDWDALKAEVGDEVRADLEEAIQASEPDPKSATNFLFFDGTPAEVPQKSSGEAAVPDDEVEPDVSGPRINFVEAIRRVMETELDRNSKLLIFGEDVGPRGGVHRATAGLQSEFGEDQVFDTSLSEEGIIGRSQGLALAGLRPLPEIQFRKYADPAFEQIHDIGWVRWRTAGKFAVPLVVRIPIGPSKRTGDPWHSVSDEAIYAHLQGWRIAIPSNAADAAGLLREALRGRDPTFFLEHRSLYDTAPARRPYPGDDYALAFGKAALVQEGKFLTVVSWGEMLHRCQEAAEPFGGEVEIIDLRTIIPWDKEAVLNSVRKTGKLLVAHEDTRTNGFASEIIASVAAEAFTFLDAPIQRVATADIPVPYNTGLMNAVIPTVEVLREKIAWLLAW